MADVWEINLTCKGGCGLSYKVLNEKLKPHWLTTYWGIGFDRRKQVALRSFYVECITKDCNAHIEVLLEDVPKELWDNIKTRVGKGAE